MQMTGAQLVQVPFTKMKNIHFSVQTISATQLHAHTGMELGLVLSGNLEVHSGSHTKTLGKQDLLLLNGYQPHNMCSADGATVLFLQISSGFGKEFLGKRSNVEFDESALSHLPESVAKQLRQHLIVGARAYFDDGTDKLMVCAASVALLLAEMIRSVPHQFQSDSELLAKNKRFGRAQRIAEFMDRYYKDKLTLAQMAQAEGITTTYMSRIFSELFHTSFQDYLSNYRLQKALPLLRESDMYLVDICMECGFSDTRYLNAVCQREFGCTATQLREKMRSGDWTDSSEPQPVGKEILNKERSIAALNEFEGV